MLQPRLETRIGVRRPGVRGAARHLPRGAPQSGPAGAGHQPVGEQTADSEPAADDAAVATLPDAATGLPTRLFDVYRGPAFTLLAFGTEQIDAAERVGNDYPGLINVGAIVGPDGGRPELMRTLVDPRGLIARRYGLAGQALVLIRPDGYVAFRGQTEQQLRTYLTDTVGLIEGREPVTAAPCEGVGHS